jgi:hypothetical protein
MGLSKQIRLVGLRVNATRRVRASRGRAKHAVGGGGRGAAVDQLARSRRAASRPPRPRRRNPAPRRRFPRFAAECHPRPTRARPPRAAAIKLERLERHRFRAQRGVVLVAFNRSGVVDLSGAQAAGRASE